MAGTDDTFLKGLPTRIDPAAAAPLRMMVVGSSQQDVATAGTADIEHELEDFVFVTFSEVTKALITKHVPDIVLSSLFGGRFDAIDLARRLSASGFNGRYRALSIGISNPAIILKEIRTAVPGIDFDLFQIDDN